MGAFTNEAQRPAADILHAFVEQSLRRMSNTNTREVHFRLLIGCCESEGARATDRAVFSHILSHKREVARNPRRGAVDVQLDDSLTIVYLEPYCDIPFQVPSVADLQMYGIHLEIGSVCAQDPEVVRQSTVIASRVLLVLGMHFAE
jgi:hypothetical protein